MLSLLSVVSGVGRTGTAPLEDRRVHVVGEEQLRRELQPARAHFEVDVDRPPRVPTRVDRRERDLPARIRGLVATQPPLAAGPVGRLVGVLPAALQCQTSTVAPCTGAQSLSASNTNIVSTSFAPSWLSRMSLRLSFSSTKYGPSVFAGVMTQVAATACSTPSSNRPFATGPCRRSGPRRRWRRPLRSRRVW